MCKMLHEIETKWDLIELSLIPHKDIKDLFLVGEIEEITEQHADTQVQLSTIRSSRYVGAIKGQVDELSKNMNQFGKCLTYITSFQIAFNSLSKVFSSSDIQRELTSETKELFGLERRS